MASQTSTALFPDQTAAVADLRAQLLMGPAQYINYAVVTDAMIWDKLVAAETEAERLLKTFFDAVQIIPDTALPDEIAALEAAGTRYRTIGAFDYDPAMFEGERWGLMRLPYKPVQQVQSVTVAFPAPFLMNYVVPFEWIRIDRKYGDMQLVPTTAAQVSPVGAFALVAMGGAVTYPQAVGVRYTCGLINANGTVVTSFAEHWDDLVDLVKRMAIGKIMKMAYLPASASISADGLSQSNSFNYKAWQDQINEDLFGPKGSNGGLFTSIHGINSQALG
ncbi:hypothetical protein GNZ12_24150 [Paraburkholderia sp. 1N]|uniref:DUF2612 domain-containing protein n=1 Tax=Paraburkholderia solitsugae TaxID=2675748 RepID=A0ABX2BUD0_9BURK|nr:hypothetical protein [Paraburkholderia solitsugae]NPT44346.1 hypothetical protein [Paraburkholderia solitsugae]